MIDPEFLPRPPETRYSVAGCRAESETLDWYCGRRCRVHRPRYLAHVAAELAKGGWAGAAQAYRRQWQVAA